MRGGAAHAGLWGTHRVSLKVYLQPAWQTEWPVRISAPWMSPHAGSPSCAPDLPRPARYILETHKAVPTRVRPLISAAPTHVWRPRLILERVFLPVPQGWVQSFLPSQRPPAPPPWPVTPVLQHTGLHCVFLPNVTVLQSGVSFLLPRGPAVPTLLPQRRVLPIPFGTLLDF